MPFSALVLELESSAQAGVPVLSKHKEISLGLIPLSHCRKNRQRQCWIPVWCIWKAWRRKDCSRKWKAWYLWVVGFWSLTNLLSHLGMRGLPGKEALRGYTVFEILTEKPAQAGTSRDAGKRNCLWAPSSSSPLLLCDPPSHSRAGAICSL